VPVRTGDRPKLSVVPETGDQEAPVGSPALAGKTIRQRDAEVHLYADRKGRVSPPLLHADREALKRFAAGEVFEHTMASYTIRSLRNGEYGDPTMESELSRMYAQKRLRENGIKPDAAPANGTPADQATTTQKETTMSDANSIEQVDIKLAAMRAAATQKLEDARADLQRANEDAAGAEQLSGFAARVKAPPQYQAAMNAAAEGPAAAKLAAQQTLSAAEISLANIAKAQVENDKQKTVAEAAAAAGGVMDQSAYA
jgi:hypothetical protein